MTDQRPTILLTRPLAASNRIANQLRDAIGQDAPILISPILEIAPVPADKEPGAFDFLIVTSANALDAVRGRPDLTGKQVFCVGERTTDAVRGLALDAVMAGKDADELVATILEARPKGRGLYLRGRHVAAQIEEALKSAGIETESTIVYDQTATPLTSEAGRLLARPDRVILPLFSERSARLLSEATASARAPLTLVAMSAGICRAWSGKDAPCLVSGQPDAESMIAAIAGALRP